MSRETREDAVALWRAVREAHDAFGHIGEVCSEVQVSLVVERGEVFAELAKLMESEGLEVARLAPHHMKPHSDGTVSEQAWNFKEGVNFIYRRPATAEELASQQQEVAP